MPLTLPAQYRLRSSHDPLLYKIVSDGRELCTIEGEINRSQLVITGVSLASKRNAEQFLYLLRYMVYDLEEEYGIFFDLVELALGEEQEATLNSAFKDAVIDLSSVSEIERPGSDLCLMKVMTLRGTLLEECMGMIPGTVGEPEVYDGEDGLPFLLWDTADDGEKIWFRFFPYVTDEMHLQLQAGVWHMDSNEYLYYSEWEEDLNAAGDYKEILEKWAENI